ncbi:hypothetical protein ACFH04_03740 [Streptomyces noboritoensis]|uniref:Uncharacterized protein n=1 Tax=Streptomyces noboritoensis TaxID=67337 RepID=A0ABV6TCM5_9ACTN
MDHVRAPAMPVRRLPRSSPYATDRAPRAASPAGTAGPAAGQTSLPVRPEVATGTCPFGQM